MSIARLGLRLAMLEALAPTQVSGAAGWPTLAKSRYHDSRFNPIDIQSRHPEVIFSLESADGDAASTQNGGLPIDEVIEIVFALYVFVEERDEAGDLTGEFVTAESDHDAEDMLDTLEDQIRYTLINDKGVRRFAPRFALKVHSEPYRDSETGMKFSCRALKVVSQLANASPDDLADFISGLPIGERRDRGERALVQIFATRAFVDRAPAPLDAIDDVLVVQTAPRSAEPDVETRRIRFNAFGLPI